MADHRVHFGPLLVISLVAVGIAFVQSAGALETPQCVAAVAQLDAALAQENGSTPSQPIIDDVSTARAACSAPVFHAGTNHGITAGCVQGDWPFTDKPFTLSIQGHEWTLQGPAAAGYPAYNGHYSTYYEGETAPGQNPVVKFRAIDGNYDTRTNGPWIKLGAEQLWGSSSDAVIQQCTAQFPCDVQGFVEYRGAFVVRATGGFQAC